VVEHGTDTGEIEFIDDVCVLGTLLVCLFRLVCRCGVLGEGSGPQLRGTVLGGGYRICLTAGNAVGRATGKYDRFADFFDDILGLGGL
jgi:hypothetical protein